MTWIEIISITIIFIVLSIAIVFVINEIKEKIDEIIYKRNKEIIRERLAALCHEQWSNWMKHLFEKCDFDDASNSVITKKYAENLARQMYTPYDSLTEIEQALDRREADRFLERFDIRTK